MRALCLALALSAPTAAAQIPINAEIKRLEAQGYRPFAGAKARTRGGELWAALFARDDGTQRLYLYLHDAQRVSTLHMELGGSQRLELDAIHEDGLLPDIEKDGSRILAFRTVLPALDQDTLVVMRLRGAKLEKLGRVPGGRFKDVDGDGRPEVVGRDRPLGALFSVSCKSFHTMAQSAWRTTIHALEGGRLVKASARHRPFYDRRIADARRTVSAIDARATEDYGGFLGLTLSVYFDYAESGRGREGWSEFRKLYPVRASDPEPVKRCLAQMEDAIKSRLSIPPDWR